MSGVTAGAICWFEQGLTNSLGAGVHPVHGLGFLPGGYCPHADGDPGRIPALADLIDRGDMPPTIAVDDGAAVHLTHGAEPRVVPGAPGRGARRGSAGGSSPPWRPSRPTERWTIPPAMQHLSTRALRPRCAR